MSQPLPATQPFRVSSGRDPVYKLDGMHSKQKKADIPFRAQSVSLAERPRSKYGRPVKSADATNRIQYTASHFCFPQRSQSTDNSPPKIRKNNVFVRHQQTKKIQKQPYAVSVQNISIPNRYADAPRPKLAARKRSMSCNIDDISNNKTKSSNPLKQVSHNKKLCETLNTSGNGTANKLLLQIEEAKQVADFERILNSNAILCERPRAWRRVYTEHTSTELVHRPRSSYSLQAVSEAYNFLFKQHEDSLQPLIDQYRQSTQDKSYLPNCNLNSNWFEDLQHLSEFYEDDTELKQEIEQITDKLVSDKVAEVEEENVSENKNFNVNLTGLIGVHLTGECASPVSQINEHDVEKCETDDEKEWLVTSMSADDKQETKDTVESVDKLAQNINSISLEGNDQVPSITFSNCCEQSTNTESTNNTSLVIHLSVPSIESVDESRPPM